MAKRQSYKSIDPFDLKVKKLRNKITEQAIADELKRSFKIIVTKKAVNITLLGKRKRLLPFIQQAVNIIIKKNNP